MIVRGEKKPVRISLSDLGDRYFSGTIATSSPAASSSRSQTVLLLSFRLPKPLENEGRPARSKGVHHCQLSRDSLAC